MNSKTKAIVAAATAWLTAMDLYLWSNAISAVKAAALARDDGIDVTPHRLGRLARKVCTWWKVERRPRIGRASLLDASQWGALMRWVQRHQVEIPKCGSVQGCCRLARHAGVRCSLATMREAMRVLHVAEPAARQQIEQEVQS